MFHTPGQALENGNPFDSALPLASASDGCGSFSNLINPVFSDVSPISFFQYRAQRFEEQEWNHFIGLNYSGFTFNYTWFDNLYNEETGSIESSRTKVFTFGKGVFLGNTLGFGLNYSFSSSRFDKYDRYRSFSCGFLLRPIDYISIGFTARDINSPEIGGEDVRRSEIYSLSVRPFVDFITLSADAKREAGEKFDSSDIILSAHMRLYGISFFASGDKENVTIGLSIPFGLHYSQSSTIFLDGYMNRADSVSSSALGISISGEKSSSALTNSRRFLEITLKDKINETETEQLFRDRKIAFYDILDSVKKGSEDSSINGILLRIDSAGLGFAQIQELREELKRFRSTGKRVCAVLTVSGNREYYLASASDEIFFSPSSSFTLTGLSAEVFFFKNILDKTGIRFESVRKGQYKSFNEPFTREHMSEEYRNNLTSLLKDLNEQYLTDIIKDRNISRQKIEDLFSKGTMSPEEARSAGFIDEIEYPGEAANKIKDRQGILFTVKLDDYRNEEECNFKWGPVPEIAVIYVTGSIIRGDSAGISGFTSEATSDETYRDALEEAFSRFTVKAVVIRIDSGGGSALASDLMWNYLMEMKKKYKKPVVFSFGNTAASGGYYIACTGDRIFCSRASVTGSIGVVSGKLSLKGLYEKLGINKDIIKMSEFADIYSESKDLTERERLVLQKDVDYIYRLFTDKVKTARDFSDDDILEKAEGRVFTGSQAGAGNLIDSVGGLIPALSFAREAADIRSSFNVIHLPERSAPLREFLGVNYEYSALSRLRSILGNIEWTDFGDERGLYYFPYKIEIK